MDYQDQLIGIIKRVIRAHHVTGDLSIRKTARYLDISASSLSGILSKKRVPSDRTAANICEKLGICGDQRKKIFDLVRLARNQSEQIAMVYGSGIANEERTQVPIENEFSRISDWYHYAILELSENKDFCWDSKWLARKLGIHQATAEGAVKRLVDVGLLRKHGATLRKTHKNYIVQKTPAEAVERFHLQVLSKAGNAFCQQEVAEKHFSSLTIPINPKKINKIKALVRRFREELSNIFQNDNSKDKLIYQFNTQLFRLERIGDSE